MAFFYLYESDFCFSSECSSAKRLQTKKGNSYTFQFNG